MSITGPKYQNTLYNKWNACKYKDILKGSQGTKDEGNLSTILTLYRMS